jgi:hypothetical protein
MSAALERLERFEEMMRGYVGALFAYGAVWTILFGSAGIFLLGGFLLLCSIETLIVRWVESRNFLRERGMLPRRKSWR